jgi:hypothetical protein
MSTSQAITCTLTREKFPGYRWAYGPTSMWKRESGGPYVAVSYTSPDDDGVSTRRESFHATSAEAEQAARTWHTYISDAMPLEQREAEALDL